MCVCVCVCACITIHVYYAKVVYVCLLMFVRVSVCIRACLSIWRSTVFQSFCQQHPPLPHPHANSHPPPAARSDPKGKG